MIALYVAMTLAVLVWGPWMGVKTHKAGLSIWASVLLSGASAWVAITIVLVLATGYL